MEQVNVWKCSFCKKTSFHKGSINKHEKGCFYNPATRSCATCLWFSPLILGSGNPIHCYLGQINEELEDSRMELKTQCERWMDSNKYWENETIENLDDLLSNLLSGNVDYYNALPLVGVKISVHDSR
jgi:hypothetical protein